MLDYFASSESLSTILGRNICSVKSLLISVKICLSKLNRLSCLNRQTSDNLINALLNEHERKFSSNVRTCARARVKYAAHTCKNITAMNSINLIILRLFKV